MSDCSKGRVRLIGVRAIGAAALLAALASAPHVFAHSVLVDASPSSKDHVSEAPKSVKLRFGAGVEPAYSKVTIETADGKALALGAVGKTEAPRDLSFDAPTLAPGKYVVRNRVLSTDGHIVEGNYEFFIDAK